MKQRFQDNRLNAQMIKNQFVIILLLVIIVFINCSSGSSGLINLKYKNLKSPVYFGTKITNGIKISDISKKIKIRKIEAYVTYEPGTDPWVEYFYEPRGNKIVRTDSVVHSGTRSYFVNTIDTTLTKETKEGFVILPFVTGEMHVYTLEKPEYYETTIKGYNVPQKKVRSNK